MLLGFVGICVGVVLECEIALVVGALALVAPVAFGK